MNNSDLNHLSIFTKVLLCLAALLCSQVSVLCQEVTESNYVSNDSHLRVSYTSLLKVQHLLDYAEMRDLLTRGYIGADADADYWVTRNAEGFTEIRYYEKTCEDGAIHTLELAVLPYPAGGFDIQAFGFRYIDSTKSTNPDLPDILANYLNIAEEIAQSSSESQNSRTGYRTYSLSYIQSDRAISTLKAIGYTTIEYTELAGETLYERIFDPYIVGDASLPMIIKMIDSPKTSLMTASPEGTASNVGSTVVPEMGGTYLHHTTSGEPLQRLLIAYDKDDLASMEKLLNLISENIDVPARQIVIEAMVIELNTNKLKELGVESDYIENGLELSFMEGSLGEQLPFTAFFNKDLYPDSYNYFQASLKTLISTGDAEILSSPSILSLDGRQARIQVGQQVPVVKSVATAEGIISSVEYFPIGIVLNLRPRINNDASEITMQVETIVSAVSQTPLFTGSNQNTVVVAPPIDNRQVETFVRIADNTPFIIGGLISDQKQELRVGIPLLSNIPWLGHLFSKTTTDTMKKEVIVVVTPHIVPLDIKNFSYVVPKDSDIFNSFDQQLFRNAYRLRDDDVFDLKFIYESESYNRLQNQALEIKDQSTESVLPEEISSILAGNIPGEDILVRRMLWEIIYKIGFHNFVNPDHIIIFEKKEDAPDRSGQQTRFLNQLLSPLETEDANSVIISYDTDSPVNKDMPFSLPQADISYTSISGTQFIDILVEKSLLNVDNGGEPGAILLSSEKPPGVRGATSLEVLQGVLVLKKLLDLNSSFSYSIKDFRVGSQLILPSEEDIRQRYYIVDSTIAQYFYEIVQYYPAFGRKFNSEANTLLKKSE